jgi:glycerophosphoryl diester phosphodiesterase
MFPVPFLFPQRDQVTTSELLDLSNPKILVAAHRGVWNTAPENSIASLLAAIEQGADIVELDVRSTRDDVLVVMHDATLDRTSNVQGRVSELNFSDIRQARLKPSNGGPRTASDERLPTLAQVLEVARDRSIVNIDVKDTTAADRVAQAVIAAGMADQVFVKADIQDQRDVDAVRASPFFGRVAFVPMMRARVGHFAEDLRWLAPLGCPMYEVAFDDVNELEAGRNELKRQGARLWVNTIDCSYSLDFNDTRAQRDPDGVWGRLLDLGVGAIQTDIVGTLTQYICSCGRTL